MKLEKFAICYNPAMKNSIEVKDVLEKSLTDKGVEVTALCIDKLADSHNGVTSELVNGEESRIKEGYDFVFAIGGDGTILKAARFYAKFETPIFGINLGRLGFLSQSSEDEIEDSVNKILNGEFKVEDRIMLKSNGDTALNDFVIKGPYMGRTSAFSLKINGKFVCDYLADGIIIATPTGSTAYGLSAGGPVLTPGLKAFVIVPICAHTLTARPLVVPDTEKITISKADDETKYAVLADGQEFHVFAHELAIEKSQYTAKLALLENKEFYSVLREKLHWGISPACI